MQNRLRAVDAGENVRNVVFVRLSLSSSVFYFLIANIAKNDAQFHHAIDHLVSDGAFGEIVQVRLRQDLHYSRAEIGANQLPAAHAGKTAKFVVLVVVDAGVAVVVGGGMCWWCFSWS